MWLFSSPCKRPCEILPSLDVCRYQCTCILLPVCLSCVGFYSITQFPLQQIIWKLYTRWCTIKGKTRLILDFNLFFWFWSYALWFSEKYQIIRFPYNDYSSHKGNNLLFIHNVKDHKRPEKYTFSRFLFNNLSFH